MPTDDRPTGAVTEPPATAVIEPVARAAFPSGRLTVGLAVTVLVLDQVTKGLVREYLPLHSSVSLIDGFLDLTHVRNTGAAFGFLNAVDIPFKPALMTAIALVALIAIAIYTSRATSQEPLSRLGLALILGGAIGNLIDRVTLGYVVDFIDWHLRGYDPSWTFPTFNIADSAVVCGGALILIFGGKAKADAEEPQEGDEKETEQESFTETTS